jgi:hypothetical protein
MRVILAPPPARDPYIPFVGRRITIVGPVRVDAREFRLRERVHQLLYFIGTHRHARERADLEHSAAQQRAQT